VQKRHQSDERIVVKDTERHEGGLERCGENNDIIWKRWGKGVRKA
jgi:hypothetical protein